MRELVVLSKECGSPSKIAAQVDSAVVLSMLLDCNDDSKAFQSFEQVALHLIGMATVQEIGSQLPTGLVVFQHVIQTH